MFSGFFLLAAAAVGINYGWEPLPDGGTKYIVQFDPEALRDAERAGFSIDSDIPSEAGDVRSVSIRMGTGELPKTNPPATAKKTTKASAAADPSSTDGENPKPWPLIVVSLCLFVFVALCIYMLWIYGDLRKRYRALMEK